MVCRLLTFSSISQQNWERKKGKLVNYLNFDFVQTGNVYAIYLWVKLLCDCYVRNAAFLLFCDKYSDSCLVVKITQFKIVKHEDEQLHECNLSCDIFNYESQTSSCSKSCEQITNEIAIQNTCPEIHGRKNLYFVEVPLNDYASHRHIILSCHHCLLYHHKTKPVHNYNKISVIWPKMCISM